MLVDENLISAVEHLIDGRVGHYYYSTIHRYKQAAMANDEATFTRCEDMLRYFVIGCAKVTAPDSWKSAIDELCRHISENGAICGICYLPKMHGVKCKGYGAEPCWFLRNACRDSWPRCCVCAKAEKELHK